MEASSVRCRFRYEAVPGRLAVTNLSKSDPVFFDQLLSRTDPKMRRYIGMPYYLEPNSRTYLEPYSPDETRLVESSAWTVRIEADTGKGEKELHLLFQLRIFFPHQKVIVP